MAGTSADKLALLKQTKADIKAAIQEKGQAVADDDTFASYPDKIRAIDNDVVLQEKTATGNGEVLPDEGYDGLSKVIVEIPDDVPEYQSKTVTENGTYTADDGYDALSSVTVNIPAPEGTREITENGVFDVEEYEKVEVHVPQPEGTTVITENGTHNVSEFAVATVSVPVPDGYVVPSGEVSITENGEHDVSGKAKAVVNVPIPDGYIKPEGSLTITENSTVNVTDKEEVNVNVQPELMEKQIFSNGTYTPPKGVDGYSKVVVDVPIPSEYIKPEGTLEITENGTYPVTEKAEVVVNVPLEKICFSISSG